MFFKKKYKKIKNICFFWGVYKIFHYICCGIIKFYKL
jgi:hypothetical protein